MTTINAPAGFFQADPVTPVTVTDLVTAVAAAQGSLAAVAASASAASASATAATTAAATATAAASSAVSTINSTVTTANASINSTATAAETTINTAATSAATSASNAATSASAAASSATTAGSSATAAAGSVTTAAGSATTAGASQTAAATSASNASTSATAAASSATAAATSATSAANSVTNIGMAAIGLRNLVVNGGFRLNQRGYVTNTATATGLYMHDRWKAGASGCTYTFTQNSSPQTPITITAGSLQQVIDGNNIVAGNYTLSWTGTALGRINGGSFTPGPFTLSGFTAGTNITVEFSTGTVGSVELDAGSIAYPFEVRPIAIELHLCQRYFAVGQFRIYGYNVTSGGVGGSTALPAPMRAVPTVTAVTPSNTNVSGFAANSLDFENILFTGTVTATGAYIINTSYTVSAEL